MLQVIGILTPFVLLGVAVVFVAFSGGPARAREAYLTRARGATRIIFPIIYIGVGIAVPALVIAGRESAEGGTPQVSSVKPSENIEKGKTLFRNTCASCHTLAAVNARGVTGPNLDNLLGTGTATQGQIKQRVLSAIRTGGTGQGRMPKGLLQGKQADQVAEYVSRVVGK